MRFIIELEIVNYLFIRYLLVIYLYVYNIVMFSIENIIKGVFLLLLAVAGNFIPETLGCKTQDLLNNSMVAKHVILVVILYFTINFQNSSDSNPSIVAAQALGIYLLFILFTKMSLQFTIAVFGLLIVTLVTTNYISYYKKQDPKNDIINKLETMRNFISILMVCLILIGFILYFSKQRTDHLKNWSTTKFLFGVTKCSS